MMHDEEEHDYSQIIREITPKDIADAIGLCLIIFLLLLLFSLVPDEQQTQQRNAPPHAGTWVQGFEGGQSQ